MQLGGPLLEKHHVAPNHTKLARKPQSIHLIYFWIQKGFRGDCEVKGEVVIRAGTDCNTASGRVRDYVLGFIKHRK